MKNKFKKLLISVIAVFLLLGCIAIAYSYMFTIPKAKLELYDASSDFNFNILNNLSNSKVTYRYINNVKADSENAIGGEVLTNKMPENKSNIDWTRSDRLDFKDGEINFHLSGNSKKIDIDKLYKSEIKQNFIGDKMQKFNYQAYYNQSNEDLVDNYLNPSIKYTGANKDNMLYEIKNDNLCILYEGRYYPKGRYGDIDGHPSTMSAQYLTSVLIINEDISLYIVVHWRDKRSEDIMQKAMDEYIKQLNNLNNGGTLDLDKVYNAIGEEAPNPEDDNDYWYNPDR